MSPHLTILVQFIVSDHSCAWCNLSSLYQGKPEIMADCFEKYYYNINDFALDPTLDLTYTTLGNVLGDIVSASGAHGSSRLHIGGDEVVTGCWAADPSIVAYMQANGYTSYYQLLNYFVQRADAIVAGLNRTAIHWEEIFTDGCTVSHDNIFQVRFPSLSRTLALLSLL
jgi:hexosaminidase